MKKHFVTFYSPGTIVAETTTQEIESWDVEKAKNMAKTITERYGAVPYGFEFSTRKRGIKDFDSKEIKRSPLYFLGGDILTVDDLLKNGNPQDETLIRNMKRNCIKKVIRNNNSFQWTMEFTDNCILLKD